MKKLNILMTVSLLALAIGSILITFGNHIGDYILISGVISGLYVMHLLDRKETQKAESIQ